MSLLLPLASPGSAKNPIYVYGIKTIRRTKYIVSKIMHLKKNRLRGGLNLASKKNDFFFSPIREEYHTKTFYLKTICSQWVEK